MSEKKPVVATTRPNLSLDALMDEKGRLSRLIGEARKSGNDFQDLLAQMQSVSAQIKALKAEQAPRQEVPQDNAIAQSEPALFQKCYDEHAANEISVSCVESDAYAQDWDDFVVTQAGASIYHQWAIRGVVQRAFGHRAPYFVARDAAGKICGLLPLVELKSPLFGHFWVSLPYFTYGGALAQNAAVVQALYQAAEQAARVAGARHIEYRDTVKLPGDTAPVKQAKVSMVRPLPNSTDALWQDIGTKVRAQIKKADAFELQFKLGKAELLADFYRVFAENMRDLGTPVYALSFFRELLASPMAEQIDIAVVYHGAKPVSAALLMRWRDMMEIPWASTLRSANEMNSNMFMYWHILCHAIDSGADFFDFGRSSKDSPTWRFKKQWGAQPQQLYWRYWLAAGGELPELNPNNPKYRLLINVWQRLPVWLTRWIGPPVVKYLP